MDAGFEPVHDADFRPVIYTDDVHLGQIEKSDVSRVSTFSITSEVPSTGYTEDHIIPLDRSYSVDPHDIAPPKFALQAATPSTPTQAHPFTILKKPTLTNVADMFRSFNLTASPLSRATGPKSSAMTGKAGTETYAAARVRLRREKTGIGLGDET